MHRCFMPSAMAYGQIRLLTNKSDSMIAQVKPSRSFVGTPLDDPLDEAAEEYELDCAHENEAGLMQRSNPACCATKTHELPSY
jgi:hypothetical protein